MARYWTLSDKIFFVDTVKQFEKRSRERVYASDVRLFINKLKDAIYECDDIGYHNGALRGMICQMIDNLAGEKLCQ